jgi:hypothetical protein
MKLKLVLMVLILAISSISILAQSSKASQDVEVKLPPGKWTLQHPVISRLGFADAPLQITSVTAKKGGIISTVRLKNNSGKVVSAVKFAWYLFREQDPKNILQEGESPVLGISGFSDRAKKVIDYPIVSFGNIYKPLMEDGKLSGDFVLEVVVNEIIYQDDSKWERK